MREDTCSEGLYQVMVGIEASGLAGGSRFPLLVAGAGPVGLVAALAARSYGLPVVVLEAEPADRLRPGSRATYVFRESMDFLERIAPGVTKPLIEQSGNWDTVVTTYGGREVYRRKFPPAPPGRFGISVAQAEQEKVLYKRCVEEGVEFRWDSRVVEVTTGPDQVEVVLSDETRLASSYLIAADGARSAVRSSLGIALDGGRSETAFVIVDLQEDPADPLPKTRVMHYRNPAVGGRNVMMVPFGDSWRLDLQCRPRDNPAGWQTDPLLRRWISALVGAKRAEQVTWVSTYRFQRAVAKAFTDRYSRVLLAGEAAHLFAPFGGGRGLNSGVPDAVFAAEAIGQALSAGTPGDGAAIIRAVADERRAAAVANRDAASTSLVHLEARGALRKVQQRAAGLIAPHSRRAATWLERRPHGPTVPVTARSRF
jgi:3-(3-hydroxy-phenyl)propionate hydroxylase